MGIFTNEQKDSRGNITTKLNTGRIIAASVGGLLALTLFFGSFVTVGPGERGVLVTFGKASDTLLDPGLHMKFPLFSSVTKVSIQINRSDVETGSASKDMQEVQTHVALNWSLNSSKVIDTFKAIGDEEEILKRIIVPAISEILKAEMARLTAEEILTKRLELKKSIDDTLALRLAKNGIQLSDLSIVNLTFSKDFTRAIEEKQIAEQKAKQAEYDAVRASKEADAEVNRAKGKAEAQRLMRSTITPEILQQQAIEKWDGSFPQVMGGNGSLPFINLKLKDAKTNE